MQESPQNWHFHESDYVRESGRRWGTLVSPQGRGLSEKPRGPEGVCTSADKSGFILLSIAYDVQSREFKDNAMSQISPEGRVV